VVGSNLKKGPVDVDDNAAFIMRFESGAYGFIEATHFSAGRKNSFGFELHGEKGTLYFDWLRMNELQYYDRADPVDREGFAIRDLDMKTLVESMTGKPVSADAIRKARKLRTWEMLLSLRSSPPSACSAR
jgi:predicted dehydrogenase